jgi:hypothetical protein
MSYERPPSLNDEVTWVGQDPYTRPDALADVASFEESGGGGGGDPVYVIETVEEFAELGDAHGVYGSVDVVEAAAIVDVVTGHIYTTQAETAVLGDATISSVWAFMDDYVEASDTVVGVTRAGANITEGALLGDTHIAVRTVRDDVGSSAVVADSHAVRAFAAIVESARIAETAAPRALAVGITGSSAELGDIALSLSPTIIVEAAVVGDTVLLSQAKGLNVIEAFAANDTVEAVVVARQNVNDPFIGGETTSNNVQALTDAIERAFIFDTLVAVGGAGAVQIWTANTWTWAMSTYSDLPLHDMTATVAAGPAGVYVPGTAPVPVRVTTGELDFKEPMKKRIPWFYMTGFHRKPLELSVSAIDGDRRTTVSYTETRRSAETDRTTRVQIGKGFNSNFYQFTIRGESPMALSGCEAEIAPTARRI